MTMEITNRKLELVADAKAHLAADMLIKGTYGDGMKNFRGCSVGCLAHSIHPRSSMDTLTAKGVHKIVAEHYGYPEWLAYLQDTIFESLPEGEHAVWHVQLAETIAALPDDFDWQAALHRVHVGILRVAYRTAGSAKEAVQRVIDLHERAGRGEDISSELWSAAESAGAAAARSAGAAAAAAESAAWSAWSAGSAARSAGAAAGSAGSAARSAWSAGSAARSAGAAAGSAGSAARSAARSAWSAGSAARSAGAAAAFQEIRDAVLGALSVPELAAA